MAFAALSTSATKTTATDVTLEYVSIPAADGVELRAVVVEPAGDGPHPIVVMPSSWGLPSAEYLIPATKWAKQWFAVVTFASRGFWLSGGEVDIAGEATVGDVSTVIDWMVANAHGDEARVGAVGISYGAGISLLAAARDPRIDSVVAMSGWADLLAALYPNQTINSGAAESLLLLGNLLGNPGPELRAIEDEIARGEVTTALAIGPSRSAINDLAALEANGTAIMFAQAWNDHIFPPSQIVDMFERYAGPKKLMLAPGDHATAEGTGLLGLPNPTWDSALVWNQRYVAGEEIDTGPVVTAIDQDSRRPRTSSGWSTLSSSDETLFLTDPVRSGYWIFRGPEEGQLSSTSPSRSWGERISGGRSSSADSPAITETLLRQFAELDVGGVIVGQIATLWTDGINRDNASVWTSRPRSATQQIVGSPELSITVETRESDLTVFAYLYEETPFGFAKLITHKPFTIRGAEAGADVSVDLRFEPILWEVNRGNRITLVIDTVDQGFRSETQSDLYVESYTQDPAALTLPFG